MSIANLWADMYRREIAVTRSVRDKLCLAEIRIQQLESQRRTMLSLLTLAARDLREKSQPFGATLDSIITELRGSYVEQFVLPHSEAAGVEKPVPRHPAPLPNASLYAASGADPFSTATSRDAS